MKRNIYITVLVFAAVFFILYWITRNQLVYRPDFIYGDLLWSVVSAAIVYVFLWNESGFAPEEKVDIPAYTQFALRGLKWGFVMLLPLLIIDYFLYSSSGGCHPTCVGYSIYYGPVAGVVSGLLMRSIARWSKYLSQSLPLLLVLIFILGSAALYLID